MTKSEQSDAKFSWEHMQRFVTNNFQESQPAHGIRHIDNGTFPWYVSRNSRRHQLPIYFEAKWLKRLLAKHVRNEVSFPLSLNEQCQRRRFLPLFLFFLLSRFHLLAFDLFAGTHQFGWEKNIFVFLLTFASWNRKCFSTKCSTVVYWIWFGLSKVKQFSSRGLMT